MKFRSGFLVGVLVTLLVVASVGGYGCTATGLPRGGVAVICK